jgi:sulfur-carrier protein adenylyltransferase/sulfurtransferase
MFSDKVRENLSHYQVDTISLASVCVCKDNVRTPHWTLLLVLAGRWAANYHSTHQQKSRGELNVKRVGSYPVGDKNRIIRNHIISKELCGMMKVRDAEENDSFEVSVHEVKTRLDKGEQLFLLDVRQPFEYEMVHLDAKLIPLNELPHRLSELDREREIILYCHSGVRSTSAANFLRSNGFKRAKNLTGGIDMWAREVDPTMARY